MIYQFKIISPDDKDFLRIIEIEDKQTFFDFHNSIIDSCRYDMYQIASFYQLDKNKKRIQEITLFEMASAKEELEIVVMDVSLIKNFTHKGLCLQYVFDFFSNRYFNINLHKKLEPETNVDYPIIKSSKGNAPPQIELGDFEQFNINTLEIPTKNKINPGKKFNIG